MENQRQSKINLEPIYTFLTEDTNPTAFAELLDDFLFDYITLLIEKQLSDCDDKTIHERTDEFLFYLKTLRNVLPFCEKRD